MLKRRDWVLTVEGKGKVFGVLRMHRVILSLSSRINLITLFQHRGLPLTLSGSWWKVCVTDDCTRWALFCSEWWFASGEKYDHSLSLLISAKENASAQPALHCYFCYHFSWSNIFSTKKKKGKIVQTLTHAWRWKLKSNYLTDRNTYIASLKRKASVLKTKCHCHYLVCKV